MLNNENKDKYISPTNKTHSDMLTKHHLSTYDKNVLIIYTGGTFGMEKTIDGLKPRKNFLYEYMLNHPNLCDRDYTAAHAKENFLITPECLGRRISYMIFEFDVVIDSSNITMDYWRMIGGTIHKFYEEYDAFIILHGTDTMNYTASVLSFMLENLNKPVIITGSMIPLITMRNDACKNLVDALTIAGAYHIPEVGLLFDSKLFRGNRTIKNDNMGLDAFESPNLKPLVQMGINIKVNWDIILQPPTDEFSYFEVISN
jgi:lysophospholipase